MQRTNQLLLAGMVMSAGCMTLTSTAQHRVFSGKIITPRASELNILDQVFSEQTVCTFPVAELMAFVRAHSEFMSLSLQIDQKHIWTIDLWENEMRSPDYIAEQTGESGRIRLPRSECITYAGNITGHPEQIVRLNITDDRIWGYLNTSDGMFYIEPLRALIEGTASDLFVVYREKSLIRREGRTCGVTEHVSQHEPALEMESMERSMTGDDCRKLEIATESDWEFYDDGETLSDIIGNLNMVEGIYQSYFNMSFLIVYQHEWTTSDDPYTNDESGCNGYGEMDQFAEYWYNNFGHIRRDINVLYSEKDYEGSTIGCAMTSAFHDNEDNDGFVSGGAVRGAYCVNEWIDGFYTETDRMRLVAHEMGHIFGASHDDSNCGIFESGNIMCSSLIYASSVFLTQAIDEMEVDMNSASDELNDGRSALRIRDFPINSQQNGLVITDIEQATGNEWIIDGQIVFGTLFEPPQPFTFQATENIKLKPGFKVMPSGDYALKLKIGACDINGY